MDARAATWIALVASLGCGRGSSTRSGQDDHRGPDPGAHPTGAVRDARTLRYVSDRQVPAETFVALSADGPCAVTGRGDVWCQRGGAWQKQPWNAGTGARELVAAEARICVVTEAGGLRCNFAHGMADRAIAQVALPHTLDHAVTCVLGVDGRIRCAGGGPLATPPDGVFRELSCTAGMCCALRREAGATCWGDRAVDGPQLELHRLSVRENGSCALDTKRDARCWGPYRPKEATGPFADLFVGRVAACGIRDDGTSYCWVLATGDRDGIPPVRPRALSTLDSDGCLLDQEGHALCWGPRAFGPVPSGRFTQLAGRAGIVCGIREDRQVACWGWRGAITATTPSGEFAQIDVGGFQACGVQAGKQIRCWGSVFRAASAPEGPFERVVVGHHPCALDSSGRAVCWGGDGSLSGQFVQLAAGSSHTCGLRADGSIQCVVGDEFLAGRTDATPPRAGSVVSLAAGYEHFCGLDAAGGARCWGRDVHGETRPPRDQRFAKLALGEKRSCGLERSGVISCWGASPAAAPAGPFVDLAITGDTDPEHDPAYVCGIAERDRSVQCWRY
jgi:hypothetical protein